MAEEKKTTLERETYNGTQVVRAGESTVPAFEKTCWKCGTKFLYISDAIKHDKDGDYVICPSCGAFVSHQESPKTPDFITPKCTSDAKGEDRSQKHSDSITTLEEAAEKFVYDWAGLSPTERRIAERAYLAGAEWMKGQMIRDCSVQSSYEAEIEKAEERGYNLCKQQMLKDAVEGEVYPYTGYKRKATAILIDTPKEDIGDKVKIVIVKEDGK